MPDHEEPGLECDDMGNTSDPAQSSQNSTKPSGQDATTSPEPVFTWFPKLPVELQNIIWGHCFKTSRVLVPYHCDPSESFSSTIFQGKPLRFYRQHVKGYRSPPPPPALHACKAAREEGKRHGHFAFGVKGWSPQGTWFNPDYDTILLGQGTLRLLPVKELRRYFKGVKHLIIHFPVRYAYEKSSFAHQDQRDQQWSAELGEVWASAGIAPAHSVLDVGRLPDDWDTSIRKVWDVVPLGRSLSIAVTADGLLGGAKGRMFHRVDDEHMFICKRWQDLKADILSAWQRRVKPGTSGASIPPHLSMYDSNLCLTCRRFGGPLGDGTHRCFYRRLAV